MKNLFTKIGIAFGTSVAVVESVNLQPLWNALITLAVSVVTVLSVEGVAWLRAWLKNKRAKQEEQLHEEECKKADEIVEIVEEHNKEE